MVNTYILKSRGIIEYVFQYYVVEKYEILKKGQAKENGWNRGDKKMVDLKTKISVFTFYLISLNDKDCQCLSVVRLL